MSEDTIVIKKESLWKYSTFILGALLIVTLFLFFSKGNSVSNGNVVVGDNSGSGNVVSGDFSFADDSKFYPYIGPKDSKVVVVEFFDFQCPFCAITSGLPEFAKQYATQYSSLYGTEAKVAELAKAGKIKLVYGMMSFLGEESNSAAEAALCANEQNKFVEMHDVIFTAHYGKENNGKYSKANLKTLAKKVSGLDQSKFASCLDGGKYSSTISTLSSNANGVGVSGTPTFAVNGKLSSGSWDELSAKIKAAGVEI